MLLMGKSTISMAIFNSRLLVYQRVNHIIYYWYKIWDYHRYSCWDKARGYLKLTHINCCKTSCGSGSIWIHNQPSGWTVTSEDSWLILGTDPAYLLVKSLFDLVIMLYKFTYILKLHVFLVKSWLNRYFR